MLYVSHLEKLTHLKVCPSVWLGPAMRKERCSTVGTWQALCAASEGEDTAPKASAACSMQHPDRRTRGIEVGSACPLACSLVAGAVAVSGLLSSQKQERTPRPNQVAYTKMTPQLSEHPGHYPRWGPTPAESHLHIGQDGHLGHLDHAHHLLVDVAAQE